MLVINEPARVKCGAPDYILTKKNIPIGYIEAKDVGKSLNSKDYKEQFDRYRGSLHNLIFTDYLNFWLYRNGEKVATVMIAEIQNKRLKAKPENIENFINLIKDFSSYSGQTITSAQKLSKMMAGKAKLLATIIENALTSDEEEDADSTLKDQMKAFEKILIHDIDPKGFADIYAQTIAYGMFAARLHDPTLDNFSRQEAAELIPQSNPFLRKLFQYIAGYDLDERIRWIVDELSDIFRATDVAKLLKDFGKATQKHDPMIHFYETFLAEYDPKLRKSRGVWYTPEPVVNFIVLSVCTIIDVLTTITDVTEKVRKREAVIAPSIEKAKAVIASETCPDVSPTHAGLGAFTQWLKIYKTLCPGLPEDHFYNLASVGVKRAKKLEAIGAETFQEIPDDLKLTNKQQWQLEAYFKGEPLVDEAGIKSFIADLIYPIYYFDYETFSHVIPPVDGVHSYQQVCFQYSLHRLDKDGALHHFEYIHPDATNPIEPLTRSLMSHIGDVGSVLVWYESFEKGRNKEMGAALPHAQQFYEDLNGRIVDLMIPFSKGLYVDARFGGSASIVT